MGLEDDPASYWLSVEVSSPTWKGWEIHGFRFRTPFDVFFVFSELKKLGVDTNSHPSEPFRAYTPMHIFIIVRVIFNLEIDIFEEFVWREKWHHDDGNIDVDFSSSTFRAIIAMTILDSQLLLIIFNYTWNPNDLYF